LLAKSDIRTPAQIHGGGSREATPSRGLCRRSRRNHRPHRLSAAAFTGLGFPPPVRNCARASRSRARHRGRLRGARAIPHAGIRSGGAWLGPRFRPQAAAMRKPPSPGERGRIHGRPLRRRRIDARWNPTGARAEGGGRCGLGRRSKLLSRLRRPARGDVALFSEKVGGLRLQRSRGRRRRRGGDPHVRRF
jgi:hypothetical protein